MDYKHFLLQIRKKVLDTSWHPYELVDKAREFAFQLYDINADGFICQTDLFSFIRDHKDSHELMEQVCYRDLADI